MLLPAWWLSQGLDGRKMQLSLTGFMEKNTGRFMKELWELLLSAQANPSGIPQQFLDEKAAELRAKKVSYCASQPSLPSSLCSGLGPALGLAVLPRGVLSAPAHGSACGCRRRRSASRRRSRRSGRRRDREREREREERQKVRVGRPAWLCLSMSLPSRWILLDGVDEVACSLEVASTALPGAPLAPYCTLLSKGVQPACLTLALPIVPG